MVPSIFPTFRFPNTFSDLFGFAGVSLKCNIPAPSLTGVHLDLAGVETLRARALHRDFALPQTVKRVVIFSLLNFFLPVENLEPTLIVHVDTGTVFIATIARDGFMTCMKKNAQMY